MTQMRKGIAAQMTRALSAPHAYVQMEIDATKLVRLRESVKKAYQAKEGIGLSFVPFVVKASAEALKKHPTFNAHWTEQGLLAKRRVNIGVAVAVDEGLIVPVIRDADTLSIHGLNAAISDVANRARLNKLRLDDFGGGTFTVDNTGYLGTNLVMPIINVPEVGIVTMEAITKRPVVLSTPDGDTIAIRPVMNMVLGIDHRANDGAGGAALLRDIKAWLESVGPDTRDLLGRPTPCASSSPAGPGSSGGPSSSGSITAAMTSSRSSAIRAPPQHLAHEGGGDGGTIELVRSSLADVGSLRDAMRGADAVIHVAGMYRVGIKASERPAMWDANVGTTERVLDAAIADGRAADRRHLDRQRVRQHERRGGRRDLPPRPRRGLPVRLRRDEVPRGRGGRGADRAGRPDRDRHAQPGLRPARPLARERAAPPAPSTARCATGRSARWARAGCTSTTSRTGSSPRSTGAWWGSATASPAPTTRWASRSPSPRALGGRRVPPVELPTALARFAAPLNDALGGLPGMPANLRETISASDGVTYWASHAKATRELGFEPRSLEQGIADTWGSH